RGEAEAVLVAVVQEAPAQPAIEKAGCAKMNIVAHRLDGLPIRGREERGECGPSDHLVESVAYAVMGFEMLGQVLRVASMSERPVLVLVLCRIGQPVIRVQQIIRGGEGRK